MQNGFGKARTVSGREESGARILIFQWSSVWTMDSVEIADRYWIDIHTLDEVDHNYEY
jgi:hypothetical protein